MHFSDAGLSGQKFLGSEFHADCARLLGFMRCYFIHPWHGAGFHPKLWQKSAFPICERMTTSWEREFFGQK